MRETVRPMRDHEVGALLVARFPRRVAEVATWEQTKSKLAAARS